MFAITSQKSKSDAILVDFQNENVHVLRRIKFSAYCEKLDGPEKEKEKERKIQKVAMCGFILTRLESIPNIPNISTKMAPDD